MPQSLNDRARTTGNGLVRSPLDFAGGVFLLGLAAMGFAGAFTLPFGTLSGIGSGLMPKVVATLVAAFGILLLLQAFVFEGDHLEQWHLRGPVFVLGAVLAFAMVIRGSTLTLGGFAGLPALASVKVPPLGLVVAGPLAVMISSLADKDTRPLEVVVFAVIMTLACGFLFKELLSLPIPFDPAGIIPEPISAFYAGVKSALWQVFASIKNLIVR
ncbi:MAG: tripartite tricarboxylate transporter TctB family protein [Hyphomonadaceae bacterium]|jgi:putative tricarboxylic transport membrane protein|nr:tripartite tricarboxylate transporter TctB family protein [Hyphomonadaceae bacterium]